MTLVPANTDEPQATRASSQSHIQSLSARSTQYDTSSDQGDMVWHVWGTGKPNLVLLHGGSGSWTHWVHTIPAFEDSHSIFTADLPGLGESPTPRMPTSISSIAEIVSAGIDQLIPCGERVHLVAFSFGGTVAAHVARLQPIRTQSLTVIGTPPFSISPDSPANGISVVSKTLSFEQARASHERNLALLMLHNPASMDELAVHIHHENLRRGRLKSRKIVRDDTFEIALRQTRCRLHGIWGEHDTTIHPNLDAIRSLFLEVDPDATFDTLPDAGHWAAYESPAEFNAVLARRLAEPTATA